MLPLIPLRLHYRATAPIPLSRYSGSLWRSGFGANLRELACVTGAPSCDACPVRHNCAYGVVFDTLQPTAARGLNARHREQPHPYVLSPAGEDETAAVVDFIVLGPALTHLPLLLRALKHQQPTRKREGEWQLHAMAQRATAPDQADTPIWESGLPWPTPTAQRPTAPPVPQAVRVKLLHPLRLRVQGEYLSAQQFTFAAFLTALLRRMEMLRGLTADSTPAFDFPGLVKAAQTLPASHVQLQWQDWARYSARQRQTIPMGGLIGSFELQGDLTAFWPYLWIGQWLHVGKGAVMGLGRYQLEFL